MFVATLVSAAVSVTYSDFLAWQKQFGKVYSSKTESVKRFGIFHDNAVRIEALRQSNPLAKFSLNRFADMTREELSARYNGFRANVTEVRKTSPLAARLPTASIPPSFDWRDTPNIVSPIQDQGECGSCWAFSAIANLESRYALAKNTPVNKLAEQSLVDCDQECGQYRFFNGCDAGCNGGLMPNAWVYASKKGIPTEGDYPYKGSDNSCQSYTAAASPSSWEFVPIDETQIAAYLVKNGPVSIAVDASNWFSYTSGIITSYDVCPKQDPNSPSLDHGVTIVGYGTDNGTDYWIVKNSWGTNWGEQGYVRVARGNDLCGIALFACSAII